MVSCQDVVKTLCMLLCLRVPCVRASAPKLSLPRLDACFESGWQRLDVVQSLSRCCLDAVHILSVCCLNLQILSTNAHISNVMHMFICCPSVLHVWSICRLVLKIFNTACLDVTYIVFYSAQALSEHCLDGFFLITVRFSLYIV